MSSIACRTRELRLLWVLLLGLMLSLIVVGFVHGHVFYVLTGAALVFVHVVMAKQYDRVIDSVITGLDDLHRESPEQAQRIMSNYRANAPSAKG